MSNQYQEPRSKRPRRSAADRRRENMAARRKKESESMQGSWLASYGDMVTLLLCFFVLLYAMSRIDVARFQRMAESMKKTFGTEAQPQGSTDRRSGATKVVTTQVVNREQLQKIQEQIDKKIVEAGLQEAITTELIEEGLLVRICSDQVLFDLGQADLKPQAIGFLQALGTILSAVSNEIIVEGHTDNLPISTERFPTNWELSTARASRVIRFFLEAHGLDPNRMRASGYGEMRPRFPNDTDEHRLMNRRVEILIKPVFEMQEHIVEDTGSVEKALGTDKPPEKEGSEGGKTEKKK